MLVATLILFGLREAGRDISDMAYCQMELQPFALFLAYVAQSRNN